ncbi:activator-dependent family glycosyltransferase [Micromonospora sp. WMMD718]|uniref:activator-dependent family glycosyltransferase n=1 Tax=Micromonospora sp. WMMD718 TaxID=3016098 RepID=UPI002415E3B2|nr:activator-dependent family glycosyltransferase [Micromonospora sp. WMMD718]MDG4752468.1 activator-dependent family glycosyltransferase [Micromonospora sp. WMMD718]
MRVLITCFAVDSHFSGCVPLAWALRTAGHQVLVAGQPALIEAVVRAGLTAAPVGVDHAHDQMLAKVGADILALHDDRDYLEKRHDRLGLEFLRGHETVMTALFYSKVNSDSMIDDVVDLAYGWQPDLVLWEPFTFAGAVAARVTGAAHARLLTMPDMFLSTRERHLSMLDRLPAGRRDDVLASWLDSTLARYGHGFDEEIVTGQWSINPMPEGIRIDTRQPTVPIRYIPYNGQVPSIVPDWLREPPGRPRLCVTLGMTARTSNWSNMIAIEDLFEVVAELNVEVVATLSAEEQALVPDVPDNVRLVEHVPLDVLLPTCAAVLHHGGLGTWATAAALGVPQLSLGYMWDAVYRAQRTEALGAGLALHSSDLTPARLRGLLARILDEGSFRHRAGQLREAMSAMPSPNDVVPMLEKLTAERG